MYPLQEQEGDPAGHIMHNSIDGAKNADGKTYFDNGQEPRSWRGGSETSSLAFNKATEQLRRVHLNRSILSILVCWEEWAWNVYEREKRGVKVCL